MCSYPWCWLPCRQIHIRNRAKTPLSWLVGSPTAPLSVQLPAEGSILLASGNATFLPSSPVQDNSDLLNQILDGKLYTVSAMPGHTIYMWLQHHHVLACCCML